MPLGTVPEDVAPSAIAFAQQSFRHPDMDKLVAEDPDFAAACQLTLKGVASNILRKEGGFVATSGLALPYLLSLSTNFMDMRVAPQIVKVMTRMLLHVYNQLGGAEGGPIVVVGMEAAGGMLVAQLAAANHAELNSKFNFVYMRKTKKESGSAQQLEAIAAYTSRTGESMPRLRAIWVDDCNSTGSSLCDGIRTLLTGYNIDVVAALYLIDRSIDRKGLETSRQRLSDPRFVSGETKIFALFDITELDSLIGASK